MKKKIIGTAFIVTLAIVAGWNFKQSKNKVKFSELALANIEALANMESGIEFHEKTGCYLNCKPTAECRDKNGNLQTAASKEKCSCGGHEY